MKRNLVFDASVLVTGYLSGDIYKTGIFRVTYEILFGLINHDEFKIHLLDIYGRERELRKLVVPKFDQVNAIPFDSRFYKTIVYPLFEFADYFRDKENLSHDITSRFIFRFCKNSFQTLGRGFRFIEKRRTGSSDFNKFIDDDLYISTFNRIPDVHFISKLKRIIIIHDLIPILHPEYFFDHENKIILENILESIGCKDNVICVSESTKQDFLSIKPSFNPDRVFVVHLAGADCFHPDLSVAKIAAVKIKYNIPVDRTYYLSVCTLEPRKNIDLLISSYERLLKLNPHKINPLLVLTGVTGWKSQPLIQKINDLNATAPGTIILTGYVTDEELAVLYSNTLAFIYPSLYEGFGLPPLEAMKCGAPVIVSDNSSLPEVVGDAGILFNARDEDALLMSLMKCQDENVLGNMKEKSLQRAEMFSWDRTVHKIIEIINTSG